MFERFNEPARQSLVRAQEEARSLRHNYIGTEHILLGVTRQGGVGTSTLNVTYDEVRAQVERIIGSGEEAPAVGQIPLTPRAKRVLERSLDAARRGGADEVGLDYLVAALIESDGVAAQILEDHGTSRVTRTRQLPFSSGTAVLVVAAVALGILIGWMIWG